MPRFKRGAALLRPNIAFLTDRSSSTIPISTIAIPIIVLSYAMHVL